MRKVQIKSLKKNPKIKRASLKSLALLVLEIEGVEDTEIDITLVDNEYIQVLNKKYRSVDSPTDVLAFPIEVGVDLASTHPVRVDESPRPQDSANSHPTQFLGDIYISLDRAEEQIPAGETFEIEVSRLLVHGILHLLGYEHSSKMEEKQEYYLNKVPNSTQSGGATTQSGGATTQSGGAITQSGGATTQSGGGATQSGGVTRQESGVTRQVSGVTRQESGVTRQASGVIRQESGKDTEVSIKGREIRK